MAGVRAIVQPKKPKPHRSGETIIRPSGPGPRPPWVTDEQWNFIRDKWREHRGGFTPFQAPANPAPGTYDPSLDANERAAGRGLLDLTQDTERSHNRDWTDTFDERLGSLAQLTRQDQYQEQDYGRNTEQLSRNYANLASSQGQNARAAGVRGGGLRQAAMKRAGNQAWEQAPLDTGIARYRTESGVQRDRIGLDYGRREEDRTTGLSRAGRENAFFGTDTAEQRFFQARQSGAELPTKPANEITRAGITAHVTGKGADRSYATAGGRTLDRNAWVHLIRRRRAA